jgi:hypothetical protein
MPEEVRNEVLGPASRPCGSCPYRRDVPSGVWAVEEYAKLPRYDQPTADQPMGVFMCHQQDERLCAGWVGCHDMDDSLALRIAARALGPEAVEAVLDYSTDVPLFSSGREAAEHGLADLAAPGPQAARTIDRLARRGLARDDS